MLLSCKTARWLDHVGVSQARRRASELQSLANKAPRSVNTESIVLYVDVLDPWESQGVLAPHPEAGANIERS